MRSYSAGLRCSILLTVPRCTKGKRPQTWGRGGWGRRLLGRQAAEMASGIRNKRSQGSNSVCAVSDHKPEKSPLSTARKARVRSAQVQDSPCEVRTLKPGIGSPRRLIRWRPKPPRVRPPLSNGPGLCVPSSGAVFSTPGIRPTKLLITFTRAMVADEALQGTSRQRDTLSRCGE
jgi:hypothetical protein